MGVGGHFWDLLKPYARNQGPDFLRNKKVAVDLSFWIVQHETAIKTNTRNPHLRLTFFRTINLFSKFGAFPVFVVDGTPSPLKSQARILRFIRASGIELSSLPVAEEGVSVERNQAFQKCVHDCVELLELLGMPVLKATGEAEALCAQLNREHLVDACITSDSDAFLFGAECVIKNIHPCSREPFECYYMSDIETGLGLKRHHLIAISLLVGNDYNQRGVQGIGLDRALRFVKLFSDYEILNRLLEIGGHSQDDCKLTDGFFLASDENSPKMKPHCSICGHPGSKRAHLKMACEYCNLVTSEGCKQKPSGFKCECSSCDLDRKERERKKHDNWQAKVCQKIAMEQNFPSEEIIGMYLGKNQGYLDASDGSHILWENPKTEMLIDFLSFHQHWEPSYIRQRMLPMLSTIFLREMASNPSEVLLNGQYEFDCIQRVKIRYGHRRYVVNWKKAVRGLPNCSCSATDEECIPESKELNETNNPFDDEVPQIHVADGCQYLSTDEDMELVQAAFPEKVDGFSRQMELKELKSKKRSGSRLDRTPENAESPSTRSVQLSITEFYRSSKLLCQAKMGENLAENSQNNSSSSKAACTNGNFSKSARRRLLFD